MGYKRIGAVTCEARQQALVRISLESVVRHGYATHVLSGRFKKMCRLVLSDVRNCPSFGEEMVFVVCPQEAGNGRGGGGVSCQAPLRTAPRASPVMVHSTTWARLNRRRHP